MNTNPAIPEAVTFRQSDATSPLRKVSLIAGGLYLLTFISIPTLVLYRSIHRSGYISSTAATGGILVGGLLEITVALAGIATAIILYPLLKKQDEGLALGLVASRVLEAGTMFAGVAFLLSTVTLKQTGPDKEAWVISQTLVFLYDRIFLLGQGLIPAINDVLLGVLLYRSGLVPRILSITGIVGALPLVISFIAIMFGFMDRLSPLAGLAAVPVAVFEFSLGLYLIVKGFKPSAPLYKQAGIQT